jgi:hypothetical protein
MTPTTENVLAVFKRATPADIRAGFRWYNRAHEFALTLSDNLEMAAGVIAALSPNNHWETNKKAAEKAFAQGTAMGTHFIANERKVDAILSGENPLSVLNGPKVTAFYRTIVNPDGFFIPTIDRHAFDIAVGITGAYLDGGTKILARKGMYDAFGLAYINAGIELCIGAPRVQAITWTTHRREKGIR